MKWDLKNKLSKKPSTFLWLIILLSCINMIYMHLIITGMKLLPDYVYQGTNQCFIIFDMFVLYLLFILLQKYKNWCILIPFTFLSFIVLFNVGYSRYFHTYVPLSLYTAIENTDGLSSNIIDAFESSDLLLLLNLIVAYLSYFIIYKKIYFRNSRYIVSVSMFILLTIYLAVFVLHNQIERERLAEHFKEQNDSRTLFEVIYENIKGEQTTSLNSAFFRHGLIINHIVSYVNNKRQEFPPKLYSLVYGKKNPIDNVCKEKNLIFIFIESLASFAINKKYSNMEITPNINKLIKNGGIYRDMKCETLLGESSDGQMIYLTGLLPLQNRVTINNLSNNTVISLCHLLTKSDIKETRMVIPTGENAWSQKRMCEKYGFDNLYSRENYNGDAADWLTDEQLFKYAASFDKPTDKHFFSVVLTSSTHSPWNKVYDTTIKINFPHTYSKELKCYLTNVHYMDRWLGWYIETLKGKNLFDNSVIIIAADHKPNIPKLNVRKMETEFDKIPIIIINSTIPNNSWRYNDIYQSSVFPTICDMFDIDSRWRGVGNSMFLVKTTHKIKEREQKKEILSKAIIMSDFFNVKHK